MEKRLSVSRHPSISYEPRCGDLLLESDHELMPVSSIFSPTKPSRRYYLVPTGWEKVGPSRSEPRTLNCRGILLSYSSQLIAADDTGDVVSATLCDILGGYWTGWTVMRDRARVRRFRFPSGGMLSALSLDSARCTSGITTN